MAQIGRENDQRPQIGRMPIARRSSVPGWLRGLMLILVNSPLSRGLTRGFTTFWCLCYSQTQTKSAWRGILVPNPYPSIDSSIRSLFSSNCSLLQGSTRVCEIFAFLRQYNYIKTNNCQLRLILIIPERQSRFHQILGVIRSLSGVDCCDWSLSDMVTPGYGVNLPSLSTQLIQDSVVR